MVKLNSDVPSNALPRAKASSTRGQSFWGSWERPTTNHPHPAVHKDSPLDGEVGGQELRHVVGVVLDVEGGGGSPQRLPGEERLAVEGEEPIVGGYLKRSRLHDA